jgi:hypothetical protein
MSLVTRRCLFQSQPERTPTRRRAVSWIPASNAHWWMGPPDFATLTRKPATPKAIRVVLMVDGYFVSGDFDSTRFLGNIEFFVKSSPKDISCSNNCGSAFKYLSERDRQILQSAPETDFWFQIESRLLRRGFPPKIGAIGFMKAPKICGRRRANILVPPFPPALLGCSNTLRG